MALSVPILSFLGYAFSVICEKKKKEKENSWDQNKLAQLR